jgi:uncharacterized protein (TIGR02246 family)
MLALPGIPSRISPRKSALLPDTTAAFTSASKPESFAVLCQLTRRIGLCIRFFFTGSSVSPSLPPPGRLPSRSWRQISPCSGFPTGDFPPAEASAKEVTPFTTRPCWAQTRRWSGRAHERRVLNARAGGLAPIRAGLLGVINGGRLSTDVQAIRDVVASWHRATAAGDVETVLKLMAEDVVFLVAGHPPMRGRSSFERGLRGLLSQNRIESTGEVQEIAVSGDLAYCWTALIVRIVPIAGGTATVRTGSALSIFRKQPDGSWVVARDANMLSAPPP